MFFKNTSIQLITRRIAITGSPATGKTTVSVVLEQLGHAVFHEQAREIIQESLQSGSDVVPWKDLNAFTERVWYKRNEQYKSAVLEKINFYDRTNVDAYAYLNKGKAPLPELWEAELKNQQFEKVFLLPVWPEIYKLDEERTETLEECYEVQHYLLDAYKELGYDPIVVPRVSVEERVAFILKHI